MNKGLKTPLNGMDPRLYQEVSRFGAKDMEICMQCGNCSASCPLSVGNDSFPRKIYRYLQLGLRDKLLSSPVPWLCYYCGECNKECPRGAEPAETMMAARRWLTTQYDWTGLAKRLYLSEAWEIGALSVLSLGIILLFVLFHGPVITDRVAVNTFVPVIWIEIGDLSMAAVLSLFLLSNAFRMYRYIMAGTSVPLRLYITQAWAFVLHFATQKRWRNCGGDKISWAKHFILVTGYMTMMTLIIVFIRWFQVDDDSWHFSSLFGYYATGVLLYVTVDMFFSRLKKKQDHHRFSHPTDWLFLVLLFFTTLTGIFMHIVRLAGWPMGTYVIYVIHLAIAVPMLVIEVPFGKWSHLFYRPFAIFLTRVREKAAIQSPVKSAAIEEAAGKVFLECIQCGTCSGVCPLNRTGAFSPRGMLRRISMDTGTVQGIEQESWRCLTCNTCTVNCPRGIDIIDIMTSARQLSQENNTGPVYAKQALDSLSQNGNPWNSTPATRMDWAKGLDIPDYEAGMAYCLFVCCTTAWGPDNTAGPDQDRPEKTAADHLVRLVEISGLSFGTFGAAQSCCGDPAKEMGNPQVFNTLMEKNKALFSGHKVKKVLTSSPHCFHVLKNYYALQEISGTVEHHVQLLDRLISKNKIQPVRKIDRVVTFHDPCYLGRHNGIYESPRRILKAVPGVTLVEMPNNRENSICCGGGGGNAWNPDTGGNQLSILRVQEAMASGADLITTACPFCIRMLGNAVISLGVETRVQVMDIAELLWQSVAGEQQVRPAAVPASKIFQED